MNHHSRRVGVNVLLKRNGKVLLPRRTGTGWADNRLAIPGGHLEEGETARSAAVREIKEELGLEIGKNRLVFFATALVRTNLEYIYYEFCVELTDAEEPINNEPAKCTELVWCDPKHLPADVQDTFRVIIEDGFNKAEHYLEIGY